MKIEIRKVNEELKTLTEATDILQEMLCMKIDELNKVKKNNNMIKTGMKCSRRKNGTKWR